MSAVASEAFGTVHATCLVLDEDGVLIRGPSGSGKSSLAITLIDAAHCGGRHARLVGDDRVRLRARNGRLLAHPHPTLAGMIEIRGLGLRRLTRTADAAVVRLVVDLVEERPRLSDEDAESVAILGLRLTALCLERRPPREYLIGEALAALREKGGCCASVSSQTHPARLVALGPKAL